MDQDDVIDAEFADLDAEKTSPIIPPASISDFEEAMKMLGEANGKIIVKQIGNKQWSVRGLGRKSLRVTSDLEALERDKHLTPLTAGSEMVKAICETLPLPSRSPLVIVEREIGSYHCAEARWINEKEIIPINCFADLVGLVDAWDGKPVSPSLIYKARTEAEQAAFDRLLNMQFAAQVRERTALERQVEGARLRLRRELGRTLRCLGFGNLNELFRKQVKLENTSEGRYQKALRRLGNYPIWSSEEIHGFDTYVRTIREEEKTGRIRLGSEIEAALNDPRWAAVEQPEKTVKLTLILDVDYGNFIKEGQNQFKISLAHILQINPSKIKVIRVRPGSANVLLVMDEDNASKLLSMYLNHDPALELLPSFTIPGIKPLRVENRMVTDPELGLADTFALMANREIVSLGNQLKSHHLALLAIQEKRAEFIDPRQAPIDLEMSEKWHQEEIAKINQRLKELYQIKS